MTVEEKEALVVQIKDQIIEEMVLLLPELLSKLLGEQSTLRKIGDEFFKNNPELKSHTDVILSVLQEVETKNPEKPWQTIVEDATPIIKERVKQIAHVDVDNTNNPGPNISNHGEL
jgi:hypothetical protein